jgi:predicted nucleic acid-binding protein
VIILDTNVVSELMRPVPEAIVVRWFSSQAFDDLRVTAITTAEILYGIEILPQGKKRLALQAGAERLFEVVFADRMLPFDDRAARVFPLIAASRRRQGRPIEKLDAQIAAIARANHAALATRNARDFEGCEMRLVNPWDA